MAIYHLTTKAISRSKGQSSIASAAYRSGEKLIDQRTGEIADYTRKQEVDHKEIVGFDGSRSELWNKAEQAEKRKDATLAKEYEVALPVELNREQKIELVREYGEYLNKRHKVAVDICIHKIDSDNPHAHILTTTREVNNGNELGDKATREWNDTKRKKHGLEGRKQDLIEARQKWEECANRALERAQVRERIDHRSLKNQGIDRAPQIHIGPTATAMERKGIQTERGDINRSRMDLDKLNQELNQVQAEKTEVRKELGREQIVKSIPRELKQLEQYRQKQIDMEHYADLLRVRKVQEPHNRLVRKAKQKLNDIEATKPIEPQGALRALKRKAYDESLKQWNKLKEAAQKRLEQLSRRAQWITNWHNRTRKEAEQRVDKHLPELKQVKEQLVIEKQQHRESIKKEFAAKRTRDRDQSNGFER